MPVIAHAEHDQAGWPGQRRQAGGNRCRALLRRGRKGQHGDAQLVGGGVGQALQADPGPGNVVVSVAIGRP